MNDGRAVGALDDTDFQQTPRAIRADEHDQPLLQGLESNRVVHRVPDVVVGHAVFAGALGDNRVGHHKLPCCGRGVNGAQRYAAGRSRRVRGSLRAGCVC